MGPNQLSNIDGSESGYFMPNEVLYLGPHPRKCLITQICPLVLGFWNQTTINTNSCLSMIFWLGFMKFQQSNSKGEIVIDVIRDFWQVSQNLQKSYEINESNNVYIMVDIDGKLGL